MSDHIYGNFFIIFSTDLLTCKLGKLKVIFCYYLGDGGGGDDGIERLDDGDGGDGNDDGRGGDIDNAGGGFNDY